MHANEAPLPEAEYPDEHVHVVAPALLVLPVGQLLQAVAPDAALYVLAEHAEHVSDAPEPVP